MKQKLGHSFEARYQNATVSCRFEPITVEVDEKAIANSIATVAAQVVATEIRNITASHRSGKRKAFNNTGYLANNIRAVDGEVLVPPDRLQNPALRERLKALVPSMRTPLESAPVKAAVEKATSKAVHK